MTETRKYRQYGYSFIMILVVAIVALAAGYAIRGVLSPSAESSAARTAAPSNEVWTCSMHPQIRLSQPGSCPLCSMPLIRAVGAESSGMGGEPVLELSDHARAMAGVETMAVRRRKLAREIRAVGKVEYNETAMADIIVRVEGYVERLFVDYTGIEVKTDDHLVEIYSPGLIAAQQELLVGLGSTSASSIADLTARKLRYLGLTQNQIEELIKTRKIQERLTLYSPIRGTVIEKRVVLNSAVKPGDILYRLANLESVWVSLDIYESELPWIQYGQTVSARSEAWPGDTFTGRVWFINPILNERTRTIKVLLTFDNADRKLKPGMFVSATIRAELMADGSPAPTGVEGMWTCPMHPLVLLPQDGSCPECQMPLIQIPSAPITAKPAAPNNTGKWTCPMHPEVIRDGPGSCPECKMDLVQIPPDNTGKWTCPMHPEVIREQSGSCPDCMMALVQIPPKPTATDADDRMMLTVPITAVLDSGVRKLVYVEKGKGLYVPVEIETGPRTDDGYPVLTGLKEGDKVVIRGGFLLDSQFQIRGLPSLFNAEGMASPVQDHSQHAMPMNESKDTRP